MTFWTLETAAKRMSPKPAYTERPCHRTNKNLLTIAEELTHWCYPAVWFKCMMLNQLHHSYKYPDSNFLGPELRLSKMSCQGQYPHWFVSNKMDKNALVYDWVGAGEMLCDSNSIPAPIHQRHPTGRILFWPMHVPTHMVLRILLKKKKRKDWSLGLEALT